MRAKRPFPLERPRKHKSLGVHTPDPLRDDPSHPHASLGRDNLQATFATGGVIGGKINQQPIPGNTAVVTSSEATGGFADGGKVKGESDRKREAHVEKIREDSKRMKKYPNQK